MISPHMSCQVESRMNPVITKTALIILFFVDRFNVDVKVGFLRSPVITLKTGIFDSEMQSFNVSCEISFLVENFVTILA